MSLRRFVFDTKVRNVVIGIAVCAWINCHSTAFGQFSGRGGGRRASGGKGHQSEQSSQDFKPPVPLVVLTPHGGEFLSTDSNCYEIVYMPLQIRIYLYDKTLKPMSAREVHVQMSLQVPTEGDTRRIQFQYVAMPAGAAEQDYVAAAFDLNQLQEQQTPITFEFSGLPDRQHPTISFTPLFSRSKIRPYVARVLPMLSDRDGISRQRICPVTGAELGSRGPVVKLYIADVPLYLSGEDCIAAVKEAPQKYVPQPGMPMAAR